MSACSARHPTNTCRLSCLFCHFLQVKCTLEGENRVMHILGHTTYAELLEQVSLKFPNAPPFALKYLDK